MLSRTSVHPGNPDFGGRVSVGCRPRCVLGWLHTTLNIFWDTLCRYRVLNCISNYTFMEQLATTLSLTWFYLYLSPYFIYYFCSRILLTSLSSRLFIFTVDLCNCYGAYISYYSNSSVITSSIILTPPIGYNPSDLYFVGVQFESQPGLEDQTVDGT